MKDESFFLFVFSMLILFVLGGFLVGSVAYTDGYEDGKVEGAEIVCDHYVQHVARESATGVLIADGDEEKAYCYVNFVEDGTKVRLETYLNDLLGENKDGR